MADRFTSGEHVRVRHDDAPAHTRAPRYVRGQVGTVVGIHGRHPLPDDVVAHAPEPRVEAVYAVRFSASGLWGAGDHSVTVNLWDSYLAPAEEAR